MGTHAAGPNAIPDVDSTRWRIDPIELTIDAASLNTPNKKRDAHLRSAGQL
jgi:polyisoprenoid-binding protein YceI